MEISKIPLDKITPNLWNPNKMPEGTFKKFLSNIKKFGLFFPILVRKKEENYEIVDGEQRYNAFKKLGYFEISCRVIEATDEEVKQIIFATMAKGKHNAYDSQEILKDFYNTSSTETLNACNLDKTKLERKTKYIHYDKGEAIQKGKKKLVDESIQCEEIKDFTPILAIPLKKEEYELAVKILKGLNKNISVAFMKLIIDREEK